MFDLGIVQRFEGGRHGAVAYTGSDRAVCPGSRRYERRFSLDSSDHRRKTTFMRALVLLGFVLIVGIVIGRATVSRDPDRV